MVRQLLVAMCAQVSWVCESGEEGMAPLSVINAIDSPKPSLKAGSDILLNPASSPTSVIAISHPHVSQWDEWNQMV